MGQQHNYKLTIQWTGNIGNGTNSYSSYQRSHTIMVKNKPLILASSDSVFRGDATKHNPEDLFLASIASCHMLWYLHLCADEGVVVVDYLDEASAVLQMEENGSGHFTEVTLHPIVYVQDSDMVAKAFELHHQANQFCFIANSLNFKVKHEAICKVQNSNN